MKVLLVVPPYTEEGLEMACKESIGVCYLAAMLRREGFGVDILDADLLGLSTQQTVRRIRRFPASLIGFSVLEGTAESTAEILDSLGAIPAHIVLGGYLPTLIPEEMLNRLENVDSIVLGEAEESLTALARCMRDDADWRGLPGICYRSDGGVEVNPGKAPPPLDDLPFAHRDLLPEVLLRGGVAGIVGSRGCYSRCSFCCITPFGKATDTPSWRGRSPESIADEMEALVRDWGIDAVSFYDSNFIGPGKAGIQRAYDIAREIMDRGITLPFAISTRPDQIERDLFETLKAAGLNEVFIGVETMHQATLDLYRKEASVEDNRRAAEILESLEIFFRPGFILYHPEITLAEIRENIDYLKELLSYRYCNKFHYFKALRIYRGCPLENFYRQHGMLIRNGWHNSYAWKDPQVAQFIQITGKIGMKMLPLMRRMSSAGKLDAKRRLDLLLGRWELDVFGRVLDSIESGQMTRDNYMGIVLEAEKELARVKHVMDRYLGPNQKRRKSKCSAA